MRQFEFLKQVISLLNRYNIEYMVTGSIVSSIQGEPRSTHDIDLILCTQDKNPIKKLLNDFHSPDYYLDADSIDDAFLHKTMFNLIDTNFGEKVDFWFLTESEFDASRFSRRIKEKIDDFELYVSSPEDTILAKLVWSKKSGGSKKQFNDALHIYEIQKEILDITYIEQWSEKLCTTDFWNDIVKYGNENP